MISTYSETIRIFWLVQTDTCMDINQWEEFLGEFEGERTTELFQTATALNFNHGVKLSLC